MNKQEQEKFWKYWKVSPRKHFENLDWFWEYPPLDMNSMEKWVLPRLWVCSFDLDEGCIWICKAGSPGLGDGQVHSGTGESMVEAIVEATRPLWDKEKE